MHSQRKALAQLSASRTGQALLRRSIAGPRMVWLYFLLAVATGIFASIATEVTNASGIAVFDQGVSDWLYAHASPLLTNITLAFTHVHGIAGVLCLSALASIWMLRRQHRFWLAVLALGVTGGMVLNVALKEIFQRARPTPDHPLLVLPTWSFPSGHTAGATAFYGVIAAYCIARGNARGITNAGRAAIVLAAIAMIALVGLSRIYLGVHYLSDVLAAIAESCAWLAATLLVCETVYAMKMNRSQKTGMKALHD